MLKKSILVLGLFVLAIAGTSYTNQNSVTQTRVSGKTGIENSVLGSQENSVATANIKQTVEITGVAVCLPLTQGVANADQCVLGIKTVDDQLFALDLSQVTFNLGEDIVGENITVIGTLQPEESAVAADFSQHQHAGIVQLQTFQILQ